MREIKFRGKDKDGYFVYGDLTHEIGGVFVGDIRVDPESVAQFVGCDADGIDIYEGDICVDKYHCEEKAGLMAKFVTIDGNDEPQKFSCYKLKGGGYND